MKKNMENDMETREYSGVIYNEKQCHSSPEGSARWLAISRFSASGVAASQGAPHVAKPAIDGTFPK